MKKLLLLCLCILTVLSLASCGFVSGLFTENGEYVRCDKDGTPNKDGGYILFGEYPQSLKAIDVEITDKTDARGYYLGSDGSYYAKITATPNSEEYTFADGSDVSANAEYYFKVEPIRWRILSESEDSIVILCDSVIANGAYQADLTKNKNNSYTSANGAPSGTFANDYFYSGVRSWLNGEFSKAAFSDTECEIILTSSLDSNTEDKIYLLSLSEATCADYGFNTDASAYDEARRLTVSDYARATGAFIKTNDDYYGNGSFWLRTPHPDTSNSAYRLDSAGGVDEGYVNRAQYGIAPVLKIKP